MNMLLESHRHPLAAWFVLLFSLSLTALAWKISQQAVEDKVQTRFELQSEEIVLAIQRRLKAYEMALYSGKAMFDASENVTRQEWSIFVSGIQIEQNFPGIQGIGYSVMLKPDELDAHTQQVQAEGFDNYHIRPEGQRDLYSSILYLEPFDWRNRRAFGYDMFSQETRRIAMQSAIDTGESAISGRVTLVQETNVDVQYGFLMYVPVYKIKTPLLTLDARQKAIQGFVYSPFRANDFMQGILSANQEGLLIELYDGDRVNPNSILYQNNVAGTPLESLHTTHQIEHSSHIWTLKVIATDTFVAKDAQNQPTIIGISGLLIDLLLFYIITVMNRKERQLNEQNHALETAKREADQANIAKSTFLATMSHEVRTPMNGIIGMLEVLNQSSLKGDQIEMVRTISDSADNLLKIISDILDFSKIEAGKLEILYEPFVVEDIVTKNALILDRYATKENVQLSIFVDPKVPYLVSGDGLRIGQVLTNLLNNAIKFSAKKNGNIGHVRLEVYPSPKMSYDDDVWLTFKVKDDGIGISPEQVERLFQPFEQASRSTSRQYGGTGLGLSISRQLVEMMGGSIGIQSQPNEGSEFIFSLPFQLPSQPKINPIKATATKLAKQTYLLIGSNDGRFTDIKRYLRNDGIPFAQVDTLEEAFALHHSPNVWIYEIYHQMPILSQLEIQLKSRPEIKLLMLMPLVEGNNRRRNARFLSQQMIMSDDNLLSHQRLYQLMCLIQDIDCELKELPADSHHYQIKTLSRDEAIELKTLILAVEDNEMNQNVIQKQLEVLGYVADFVSNGQEALQAWRSGIYGLILTDVHMPVMDGLKMTQHIRTEEAATGAEPTPIIALSANILKTDARACLKLGMNDYLVKPAMLADIQKVLNHWLPQIEHLDIKPISAKNETSIHYSIDQSKLSNEASLPELAGLAVLDLDIPRQLIGNHNQMIYEVLQDFKLSALKTEKELQGAMIEANLMNVHELAHRFKSSVATIGAMRLKELCLQIEKHSELNHHENVKNLLTRLEIELKAVFNEIQESESALKNPENKK